MSRTQQGLLMLVAGILAALVTTGLAIAETAELLDGYTIALRWTGRLAFLIFIIPFIASPLRKLLKTPFTARLVRWRRSAGIAYGGVQSVHILIIAAVIQTSDTNPFDTLTMLVGGLGLALAVIMMLTSFDVPAKLLGPRLWKLVHRSGFCIFALVYFYDFLVQPFVVGVTPIYWPFIALTAGAFLLRIVARLKPVEAGQKSGLVSS